MTRRWFERRAIRRYALANVQWCHTTTLLAHHAVLHGVTQDERLARDVVEKLVRAGRITAFGVAAVRACDCGHDEAAHSIEHYGNDGRHLSWWCDRCSCARYRLATATDEER